MSDSEAKVRSQMPGAAELFSHHAFLDLETTGLDPSSDEVIEVGVLRVENGEVVERHTRLFKPRGPLPLAIRRLTGLTDEDLAGKPAFDSFVDELRFLFISGDVYMSSNDAASEIEVIAIPSIKPKCGRCWHRREDVGTHQAHPTLCGRCVDNVDGNGEHRKWF